jgi:hypothetical protein
MMRHWLVREQTAARAILAMGVKMKTAGTHFPAKNRRHLHPRGHT